MLGVDSIHPNPRELITMKLTFTLSRPLASTLVGVALALAASTSWGVDASAAESLARRNSCFKCHAASGGGEAPAFKKIAAKYKGQDVVAKLMERVRKGGSGVYGPVAMTPTGTDKISDADLKTVIEAILKM